MELPSYFSDFLAEIRPTSTQREDSQTGHRVLRERLEDDDDLAPCLVTTFLQGSYRRATAVRPHEGTRSDVDVIVVTRLDRDEYAPSEVVDVFRPFLDRHYAGKYEVHDRAIAIQLSYVDLDLVVTSAPSESEIGILTSDAVTGEETPEDEAAHDWRLNAYWLSPVDRAGRWDARYLLEKAQQAPQSKTEPLYIPSRDLARWEPTDPLAQITWTWEKNRSCNGHYVNVVKALKWWRRLNDEPKYPKGYPLEHLIGACCPDGIASVAEGVVRTLETIRDQYQLEAALRATPKLPDHGVPEHDVLAQVSGEDFATFHALVADAAPIARDAFDALTLKESACLWWELFGDRFPEAGPDEGDDGGDGPKGGFTSRREKSVVAGGRFA